MFWPICSSNGLRPVGSDSELVSVYVGPLPVCLNGWKRAPTVRSPMSYAVPLYVGALRVLADEREGAADREVVQQAVVHRQRVGDRVGTRGLDAEQVEVAGGREPDVDLLVADVAVVQVVVGGRGGRRAAASIGGRSWSGCPSAGWPGRRRRPASSARRPRNSWRARAAPATCVLVVGAGGTPGTSGAAGPGVDGLGIRLRLRRGAREQAARERQRRAPPVRRFHCRH